VENPVVDIIDRAILATLRSEGRISFRELGDQVGLGPTATADRVRRLERRGVIAGYRTLIDPSALGIGLVAIVELKLDPTRDPAAFETMLASVDEVQSAYHVTGGYDYLLRMACADVSTLDHLLRGWKRDAGVVESSTRIVLAEIDLGAPA
jgi:Lrp/AsnC family leucine-responsive transcriptional regulator